MSGGEVMWGGGEVGGGRVMASDVGGVGVGGGGDIYIYIICFG